MHAGKEADDPQNTEDTLTDNTDSRVGLKDTTDTTPGYFYKGEVCCSWFMHLIDMLPKLIKGVTHLC